MPSLSRPNVYDAIYAAIGACVAIYVWYAHDMRAAVQVAALMIVTYAAGGTKYKARR